MKKHIVFNQKYFAKIAALKFADQMQGKRTGNTLDRSKRIICVAENQFMNDRYSGLKQVNMHTLIIYFRNTDGEP